MTSEQPDVDEKTGEVLDMTPVQRDALTEFGRDEIGMDRALGIANRLDSLIREKELFVNMGRKDHILVEAWCACASMVGVAPKTEWTKEIRNLVTGEFEGNKARVEVIQISTGQSIGAAEASCFANEVQKKRDGTYLHRWVDDCPRYSAHPTAPCKTPPTRHAIESMAQTRATSKAIAQVLRWIPVLAGYSGTPAEEMPPSGDLTGDGPAPPRRPSRPAAPSKDSDAAARRLLKTVEDHLGPAAAGSYIWPLGKWKGKPISEVDDSYLEWAEENLDADRAGGKATEELKRRHGDAASTQQEPEDHDATASELKRLRAASYDRARELIEQVRGEGGKLKHDTEDALAASIRKWAMQALDLAADAVKGSHIEPLRRAVMAADITAAGETFVPAHEDNF